MSYGRENNPQGKETGNETDTKDITLTNTTDDVRVINPLLWLNKESQKKAHVSELEKLERRILSTFFMENRHTIMFKPDELYEVTIENKKYNFKLTNLIVRRLSSEPSKGERFEILDTSTIGRGTFGDVLLSLGCLIPNPDRYLDLRIDKPRVVKAISNKIDIFQDEDEFKEFVQEETLLASSINYLRIKQPVFTEIDGKTIALCFMRYIRADSLDKLFYPNINLAEHYNSTVTPFMQLLAGNEPTKDKIFAGYIKFCIRTLQALQEQVHDNNRIHRDIKTDNLLVLKNSQTSDYELYFIDFGISKVKNACDKIKLALFKDDKIGTPAPELLSASAEDLSSKSISNEKSDLYSLSLLLREAGHKIGIPVLKPRSQNEAQNLLSQQKLFSLEENKLSDAFVRMEDLNPTKRLSVEESLDIFEDISLDLKLKSYEFEKSICDSITAANKSARVLRNELRIIFNTTDASLEAIKCEVINKVITALEKFPNEPKARKEFLNTLNIKAFQDSSFINNPAKYIEDIYSAFSKNLNDLTHLLSKADDMKRYYSANDQAKTNILEKIIKDINIILNKRRHYKLGVDDMITLNQYFNDTIEQFQPLLDDIELRYALTKVIVDFKNDHKNFAEDDNIKSFQAIIDNTSTTSETLQSIIKDKCEGVQTRFYGSELEKRILQAMNIFMENKTQMQNVNILKKTTTPQ